MIQLFQWIPPVTVRLQPAALGQAPSQAPDPPEPVAIENSIQLLVELGALTKGEELTALGLGPGCMPLWAVVDASR